MEPIRIQYEKSTGKHFHVADDEQGTRTEITALPPQASLKAVKARAKAMGLKMRGNNGAD